MIITYNHDSAGSRLTRSICADLKKPFINVDVSSVLQERGSARVGSIFLQAGRIVKFIQEHQISTLNVAGNREIKSSSYPFMMSDTTIELMTTVFLLLENSDLIVKDTDLFDE